MKRFLPPGPLRRAGHAAALLSLLAVLIPASARALPEGRGWELVSPVDKNGGAIAPPEGVFGGGVFQAAADGNAITYSSGASFAGGALSAPPGSQYLSGRGEGGWSTANLDVPIFSGSYGADPDGVPYQLFSPDLGRALLLNGRRCRSEEAACPVANPPLAGTDAPAGYQNYYLRQGAGFEALLGSGDVAATDLDPAGFELRFAGASPDLTQVVLESCAALAPGASEVPLGAGCDPGKPNLYRWSGGALGLVNAAPGAELAAQAGAVSTTGSRVYWRDLTDGTLHLREGAADRQVDADAGEDGSFQTASLDGSVAYFTTPAGHLWRYLASTDAAVDLTPAGAVLGVFGASADGSSVYYLAADGLYLWHSGTTTKVPTSAGTVPTDTSNFPPSSGTARVSADGTRLVFLSEASLTAYNNLNPKTGLPETEVFLYDAGANVLRCVSCRPNGTRPVGPSSVPGAYANGELAGATATYKPRVLSASGNRVFFDSEDSLVGADTNNEPDVYLWKPKGVESCTKAAGCIELISDGRAEEGARFIDASLTGDDAFFVTDGSLVGPDPGSVDLYDARVGGGFPEAPAPIPCFGDACEDLPGEPVDPALNTTVTGPGNPKVRYFKYRRKGEKQHCPAAKKKQGRCKKSGKKGKAEGKTGKGGRR